MQKQLEAARQVFDSLPAHLTVLEAAAAAIVQCLDEGGKLLTCGNGGSCAEAQHLATELVGRYQSNRRSLPAIYLGNASMITCIANDFGWDATFARALQGLGNKSDILVCFSTSGQSRNLTLALQEAQTLGIRSLAFLGKGGGEARGLATWEIIIDSQDTARIQEAHLFLLHWLCDQIEQHFV